MRFFAAVTGMLLAAAPAFVHAQDPNQPPPQGQGQMVMVGNNGQLTFEPPSMSAPVGSNVTFMFMSKNHSIVQSSFTDPCNPVASGFAAQFFPVPPGETNFPTVTISVTSDKAIWFYCPQTNPANHCKAGMVGAINPPPDKTFEQFQAIAKGAAPPPAAEGGSTSVAGSTAPGAPPAQTGAPGAPSAPPTANTPPVNGSPLLPGSTSSGTAALPSGTGGTSTNSNQGNNNGASLPQMKGAFTAVVVLVVASSLL